MTTSVLIPWRSTDPWREAALVWTSERYKALGWEVMIGSPATVWCKPEAVHAAARFATGDVFVVADADCWADGVEEAVASVRSGENAWVVPGKAVRRLDAPATRFVLKEGTLDPRLSLQRTHPYVIGGGVTVIEREAYFDVPLDPIFVGWGGEDIAWGWALNTLVHPTVQYEAWLWHLWHPWAPDHRKANQVTEERAWAYREAIANGPAMRVLVDEGKRAFMRSAVMVGSRQLSGADR